MNERDTKIIELASTGLSARKISKRLGLVSERRIQRILREHRGPISTLNNSHDNNLYSLRPLIELLLVEELGKDPFLCEICDEQQAVRCDIHHTKYEGATIHDLQYACRSCNTSGANKGLI
jgi:hypothetical protein